MRKDMERKSSYIHADKNRFYWPRLAKLVEVYVRTCHECQQRDYRFYGFPRISPEPPTLF